MTDDRVPSPTLEEWATERDVVCVVCPDCAFTFDAGHTDEPGGGYSCPLCAELALLERVRGAEGDFLEYQRNAARQRMEVEAQVVALREALRELAEWPGGGSADLDMAMFAGRALADLPLPAPELSGD